MAAQSSTHVVMTNEHTSDNTLNRAAIGYHLESVIRRTKVTSILYFRLETVWERIPFYVNKAERYFATANCKCSARYRAGLFVWKLYWWVHVISLFSLSASLHTSIIKKGHAFSNCILILFCEIIFRSLMIVIECCHDFLFFAVVKPYLFRPYFLCLISHFLFYLYV